VATSGPKLWQKEYQLDALAERYEIGDDAVLDNRLVPADVWGSMAHAIMLHRIGILSGNEANALLTELAHVLEIVRVGVACERLARFERLAVTREYVADFALWDGDEIALVHAVLQRKQQMKTAAQQGAR